MSHIFISYSQADSDFSEILHNKLEQNGFTIWRDVAGLRAGDEWRKGIDEAIRQASALIVVMTPEAKASEYVTYEWAFAWGAGVKLIPLLLKQTELHPRLGSLQHLEFMHRQARPWAALIELLKGAEALEPVVEKPQAPEKKVNTEDARKRNAYERMKEALSIEKWTFRTIERLATKGGVTEEEAIEILRDDPDIIFSKTKSGRKTAKLRNRTAESVSDSHSDST